MGLSLDSVMVSTADKPELFYISYHAFTNALRDVALKIRAEAWQPDFVIGIGRGGLVPGVYMSHLLNVSMLSVDHSAKVPDFADELLVKLALKGASGSKLLFVDDINDSGGTISYLRGYLADHGCKTDDVRFCVMLNNCRSRATVEYWSGTIDRDIDKRWFVFPWESFGTSEAILEEALSVPERLA